jgi:hypothetical protein
MFPFGAGIELSDEGYRPCAPASVVRIMHLTLSFVLRCLPLIHDDTDARRRHGTGPFDAERGEPIELPASQGQVIERPSCRQVLT